MSLQEVPLDNDHMEWGSQVFLIKIKCQKTDFINIITRLYQKCNCFVIKFVALVTNLFLTDRKVYLRFDLFISWDYNKV